MMLEEKIAMAQTIRGRDRFGPVSPEELAALPGTETELHIPVEGGRTVHVYEERPDHLNVLVWDVDYCIAPEEPFPAAVAGKPGAASKGAHRPGPPLLLHHLVLRKNRFHGGGIHSHSAGATWTGLDRRAPCCVLMEYFPTDQWSS